MPQSDVSDEKILELIGQERHRERGFQLLMEKFQERLYWQVRRLVFDHEDAADVLQNCMIKVYRSIHHFEGKSKLYTWLYRIATNEAITFLNKKKLRAAAPLDGGEYNLAAQIHSDPWFNGDAAQVHLLQAIATLPDKQRLVFNLRYFDELGYAEMSEILDTSEGALKASFHHAVKKVEHFLKGVEVW